MTDGLKIQIGPHQPALATQKQQQNSDVGYSAEVVSVQPFNQVAKTGEEGRLEPSPVTETDFKDLQAKVAQLNEHMQNINRQLQFKVDDQSGDTVVTVINSDTEEVVRQIPSEEVLAVRSGIEKYRGMLLEIKA